MSNHLVSHIKHKSLRSDNTLHVIGMISNTVRWNSRSRLFKEWYQAMLNTPNVKVYIVEVAFGDRHHEYAESDNPCHLQLRSKYELWHKENALNLGIRHLLPHDWKYLSWTDCDVFWPEPYWAQETIQQLQHHPVVQPWEDCIDLGFNGNILTTHKSFCYLDRSGQKKQKDPKDPYKYAHPGFSWACTRAFWESIVCVGGLIDFAVLGSADWHMAWSLINETDHTIKTACDGMKRRVAAWQAQAYKHTQGNVGFVKTRIEHRFHGPKAKRYYRERGAILAQHQYCPEKDIAYDEQGLIYIPHKPKFIQDIGKYLRSRCEDSIEDY